MPMESYRPTITELRAQQADRRRIEREAEQRRVAKWQAERDRTMRAHGWEI